MASKRSPWETTWLTGFWPSFEPRHPIAGVTQIFTIGQTTPLSLELWRRNVARESDLAFSLHQAI